MELGGGTALIGLMLKADLGMARPVVCVDPSEEMLAVARKNGAITVRATAEHFFTSKPEYSLNTVLIIGSIHHFTDPEFVLTRLAQYMPDTGRCLILKFDRPEYTLPFFKAVKESFDARPEITLEQVCTIVERINGLKYVKKYGLESMECEKSVWYDSIRNRFMSSLKTFSDQELEQGINELEERFKDQDILDLELAFEGIVITKQITN